MGGGGVRKISIYSYFEGGGGQTHSYVIFSKSIFFIRNRAASGLVGIIFHLSNNIMVICS